MPKLEVDAWSLIEVDMDEKLQTFTVKRRLKKEDLGLPGLKPTFIFYINGAQVVVNEKGYFLLRWKAPKYLGGKLVVPQPLIPSGHVPRLKRLFNKMPLARLAKKSMKQLFFPAKIG